MYLKINNFFIFQVCSNEATCICHFTWAGTDCSIDDPVRDNGSKKDDGPKGLCDFSFTILHMFRVSILTSMSRMLAR